MLGRYWQLTLVRHIIRYESKKKICIWLHLQCLIVIIHTIVIGPELEPHSFSYFGDIIIITTDSFEDRLHWLDMVLKKTQEAGLRINRKNSKFCCSEVKYLGVVVPCSAFWKINDMVWKSYCTWAVQVINAKLLLKYAID